MDDREPEKTIGLPIKFETTTICPFTEPQGKRIGDFLIAIMFIVPVLLLIYFSFLIM